MHEEIRVYQLLRDCTGLMSPTLESFKVRTLSSKAAMTILLVSMFVMICSERNLKSSVLFLSILGKECQFVDA